MKCKEIAVECFISSWVKEYCPDSSVIIVFLDTADDLGEKFFFDFNIHNDVGYPIESYAFITGSLEELENIMKENHAKEPYMQLYIKGEYSCENT